MKKFSKIKKLISVLMIVCMITGMLTSCGSKKTTNQEPEYLTRAQWIHMLAQSLNMDTYEQEEAYYSDVNKDSDIFTAVQACREWGVISDSDKFNPNDVATLGFIATTSVIASEGDYKSYSDSGNESTDIIEFAKHIGIVSSEITDKELRSGATYVDANIALQAAAYEFSTLTEEEKNETPVCNVQMNDKVNDYSSKSDMFLSSGDGSYIVSAGDATKFNKGNIFIAPANKENPSGLVQKVVSTSDNGDGTYTITTEMPEFEEVFSEFEMGGCIPLELVGGEMNEGFSLASAGDNDSFTTYGGKNKQASFIGTTVNSTSSNKDYTAKDELSHSYTIKIEYKSENGRQSIGANLQSSYASNVFGKITEDTSFKHKFQNPNADVDPSEAIKEDDKNLEEIIKKYANGEIDDEQLKKGWDDYTNKKIEHTEIKTETFSITGELTLTDLYIKPEINFNINKVVLSGIKNFSVDLGGKFKLNVKTEGKIERTIPIYIGKIYYVVPAAPVISVGIDMYLVAGVDGQISLSYEVDNSTKLKYENKKWKTSSSNKTTKEVKASVDAYAGPKLKVSLNGFGVPIADVSVVVKADFEGSASLARETTVTDDPENSDYYLITRKWIVKPKLAFYIPLVDVEVGMDGKSLLSKAGLKLKVNIIQKTSPLCVKLEFVGEDYNYEFDESVTQVKKRKESETQSTETTTQQKTGSGSNNSAITLDISDYYASVKKGESRTITVDSIPSGYSKEQLKWSTSDSKVADVNNGTIKSNGVGTCTISVATADGKYKCQCTVVVTE